VLRRTGRSGGPAKRGALKDYVAGTWKRRGPLSKGGEEGAMTKWAGCGVGLLLVVLPGCLAVPIPAPERVVAGSQVTPGMTAPIQPGVTTRSEIIQLLGEPALDLPAHRIIAYRWEALVAHMAWFIGSGYSGWGGVEGVHASYVLLIAFDANDRVVRFEKTTQRPWDSVSEHALKWAEREGLVGPTAPALFTARVVPAEEALLYLYREGGFADRPDVMLPPPEVRVNGKLLGGLRRGEYRVLAVEPGSTMVAVDSLPRQDSKARRRYSPVTYLSVQTLPGEAHYVKVRVRYGWGDMIPVLTECPEEEALPLLKERQLAP
jgi:hypothetical protein